MLLSDTTEAGKKVQNLQEEISLFPICSMGEMTWRDVMRDGGEEERVSEQEPLGAEMPAANTRHLLCIFSWTVVFPNTVILL